MISLTLGFIARTFNAVDFGARGPEGDCDTSQNRANYVTDDGNNYPVSDASSEPEYSRVRGSLPRARANARTVAALTSNPGCSRRRVIDSASVAAYELAERLGHPTLRGQSPFAIESGNRFEDRLKRRSGYALLVDALRPYVELPTPPDLIIEDVNNVPGRVGSPTWMGARIRRTEDALARIANGDAGAPHIVDHPVLRLDLAGEVVNLEPDALAFRSGERLELVEIKSYPIIDDQADPGKLSSTAGQAAVYHMALRGTLERLGLDPDLLEWSVILVAPRNFGRTPVAHRIPLKKKVMSLRRVLASLPRTAEILRSLPDDFSFDVDPASSLDEDARSAALAEVVRAVPALYVPDCIQSCDMAKFCRHEAWETDDPTRLGRDTRDMLAGIHSLSDALRLARGGSLGDNEHVAEAAGVLQSAWAAVERARARTGSRIRDTDTPE